MPEDYGSKFTDEETKRLNEKIDKVYREARADIQRKMDDFNRRYEAKDAMYREMLDNDEITKDQYQSWQRGQVFQGKLWQAKRDQIENVISKANHASMGIINGGTPSVFAENMNFISFYMEKQARADFGFVLADKDTVTRLIKDDPDLLPKWKINEPKDYTWNKQKLGNCVTQGIIQGESLDKIGKRISDGLASSNRNHMMTFARTAMTGAQNAGRQTQMERASKMGIKVEKQWMATLDSHTRDSHARLDGETVPLKEAFSNDCMYPGDPGGPPAEVYNCRCTMVSEVIDYPSNEYERRDNINGMTIRNMTYNEWEKVKTAEKRTGVTTFLPTPTKFKKDFDIAKATITKNAWRVDDTYTVEDYKHKKLFELRGGSTVAVTDEGDIVSVCKNAMGGDRGSDLLKIAVANGGDRLDAFGEDLYHFYTKNGFEPVSWTPFNEEYAPHDWVKGKDKPEPVIFYMYTGQTTSTLYSDFLSNISPCVGEDGYGDAMVIRNKLIDSKK